jgi:hypothetical protein
MASSTCRQRVGTGYLGKRKRRFKDHATDKFIHIGDEGPPVRDEGESVVKLVSSTQSPGYERRKAGHFHLRRVK